MLIAAEDRSVTRVSLVGVRDSASGALSLASHTEYSTDDLEVVILLTEKAALVLPARLLEGPLTGEARGRRTAVVRSCSWISALGPRRCCAR